MYGAIMGDIVGSRYEHESIKTKDFPLVSPGCTFTDDTVMTVAVARALLANKETGEPLDFLLVREMQALGRRYPYAGYGERFWGWLCSPCPVPYGSFGNGSAMRISPCGLWAQSLGEALTLAELSAAVTHDHPEGIRGAQAAAAAVYMAKTGRSKAEIAAYIRKNFYPLDRSLAQIRPGYGFDVSCQGSVPQAIEAFLEADSYEDALRNAVSLGGDSDTQAAIAGSIAWAYYCCKDRDKGACRALLTQWNIPALLPREFVETIEAFAKAGNQA